MPCTQCRLSTRRSFSPFHPWKILCGSQTEFLAAMPGHLSHCAAARLGWDWLLQGSRGVSWLTWANQSYLFLLLPCDWFWQLLAEIYQQVSVTWPRTGPISAKLSHVFFSLWMWAGQLKPWLLWKASCDFERSLLWDKAKDRKGWNRVSK